MTEPIDLSRYITDSAMPGVDDAAMTRFAEAHATTDPVTLSGYWTDPVTVTVPLLTTFAGLIDTFRRAAKAFAESMRPLQAVLIRFSKAAYATIDRAYVEAHPGKRLPKPTKARWRKKRQTIVLAWFEAQFTNHERSVNAGYAYDPLHRRHRLEHRRRMPVH